MGSRGGWVETIALLAVLASACGSAAGGTASHGSPSSPSSPIASPFGSPVATPTPSGAPASPAGLPSPTGGTAANLTCSLPITAATTGDEPLGGWITFPGGAFARDPASLPARSSNHFPSYDRALGAWVPVEFENVAPDGASYVLFNESSTEVPNAFYIVDAKTGSRRLVPSGQGPGNEWYAVLKYANEGIYLAAPGGGMAYPVPGLWLMDPKTGGVRLIDHSHIWFKVGDGAAWSIEPPVPGAASYKVYRLDLQTEQIAVWYETSTAIRPLSPTPDGRLLVLSGEVGSYRIGVVSEPNVLLPLGVPPDFKLGNARMTRPGVWLSLTDGIALYTKTEGIKIMASSAGFGFYDAAGDCW